MQPHTQLVPFQLMGEQTIYSPFGEVRVFSQENMHDMLTNNTIIAQRLLYCPAGHQCECLGMAKLYFFSLHLPSRWQI